ncbi:glucose-6-phosphate isomerase 1 [Firmicutes bacterium CAG:170]|nr:glucose-6-phosphate isomerase 1 [Firmicutes bacterium CAG:170]
MVRIDRSGTEKFVQPHTLDKAACKAAIDTLVNGTGAGNDFTGWVNLPVDYDKEEFARIQKAAEKIKANSKALVVIGIGGSYLGARAVIELLKSPNYNALPKDTPDVYFLGNGISSDALTDVVTMLGDRDFSVNVISKSGTTTEPAIAFRIFKEMLEKKYGKEGARERIFATTDKARGALKTLATQEDYETFVVPDNVGGRYSVLTAVGLLPIACCGIDIVKLMQGAAEERETLLKEGAESAAAEYAMQRQYLYKTGKSIEILAAYEPSFRFMSEWWKQLYGESEGKDKLGIFPASVDLTPDLHSMGQYMQDGLRNLQETVVFFDEARTSVKVPEDADNLDGLNYLAGREMSYINEKAMEATRAAHVEGGVPVTILRLPKITEEAAGALIYFFEFACGVSGYMSGVNPFNQPGVEAYKKNMFHLLGKPGY